MGFIAKLASPFLRAWKKWGRGIRKEIAVRSLHEYIIRRSGLEGENDYSGKQDSLRVRALVGLSLLIAVYRPARIPLPAGMRAGRIRKLEVDPNSRLEGALTGFGVQIADVS
jgi:hypothetical protein